MKQIISLTNSEMKHTVKLEYNDNCTDERITELKNYVIKSLGFLQLEITLLDDSNKSEIQDIMAELESTVNTISTILSPNENEEFYGQYYD